MTEPEAVASTTKPRWFRGISRPAAVAALIAAAAVGAGATALAQKGRTVTMVALAPEAVSALQDDTMAAVKGEVAEIFGNKFVLGDATGRALVETGRRGEGTALVSRGEAVTVQGRFRDGFLRAVAITHADGRSDTLDAPPPPPPPAPDRPERGPRPPV